MISSLEKQRKTLESVLRQLQELGQMQQGVFTEGNPDAIQRYTEDKQKASESLNACLSQIRETAKKAVSKEQESVNTFLTRMKKELQPLFDQIIAGEKNDQVWLLKIKDGIQQEIDDVQQAKKKLHGVKKSYGSTFAQNAEFFDDQG